VSSEKDGRTFWATVYDRELTEWRWHLLRVAGRDRWWSLSLKQNCNYIASRAASAVTFDLCWLLSDDVGRHRFTTVPLAVCLLCPVVSLTLRLSVCLFVFVYVVFLYSSSRVYVPWKKYTCEYKG